MSRRRSIPIAAAGLSLLLAAPVAAQSLARRVAAAPGSEVAFHYSARPGACGEGDAIIVRDGGSREKGSVHRIRGSFRGRSARWDECLPGPVRVRLLSRSGRVEDVEVRVGEGLPGGTDLGEVEPQEAADYLLDLAAVLPADAGGEAIVAAVLGRGVTVHPRLLELAASDGAPTETRRSAVFWAGQEGAPLADLRRLFERVPDRVKEHVVFAYSQRHEPEAARELLRLARSAEESRGLREKAVFWLGQVAGRAVTGELGEMVDDGDLEIGVREQAVFALSQRPADEAVPALIRVVRESPDPRLRKKAIFWLGQSGDPRALSLFEELLRIR